MTLLDQTKEVALHPVNSPADLQGQLIRLASDPNVDVAKLDQLVRMVERQQDRFAEQEFNTAMNQAQTAIRPIAADAENPQTRSDYASYGQLDKALRPIYTKHGFSLSFDTAESPLPDHVRVICKVSHVAGHTSPRHIDMPADGKGAKGGDVMTKTHAVGSAVSYGMRYLLKMIFNVAVGEYDGDGNGASQHAPEPPAGIADWWTDMQATAEEGHPALKSAWETSPISFRDYVSKFRRPAWEALKVKAANVTAKAKAGK